MEKLIIIKEDGYVDTDALLSGLKAMKDQISAGRQIMENILAQLGVPEDKVTKMKEDAGQVLDPFEIIRRCEVSGNRVRLPDIQFNKKVYARVKKLFEDAGAGWEGNKTQAFVFPFNPDRIMEELRSGKEVNIQQDYQFFETPDAIADWLVELAGGIRSTDKVLEPSAGRGALVRAIHRSNPDVTVDCCEMMPENREFLRKLPNVNIVEYDFTQYSCENKYSKIIANPPFSNNQDVEHVYRMYNHLRVGGMLVSVIGTNWSFAQTRKSSDFRKWLEDRDAKVYDVPKGAFMQSGTTIATKVIVINKNISNQNEKAN
jgi:hypothetical protein